jgi:hypothetical protein
MIPHHEHSLSQLQVHEDTQASVRRVRSRVQRWNSPQRLGAIGLASF